MNTERNLCSKCLREQKKRLSNKSHRIQWEWAIMLIAPFHIPHLHPGFLAVTHSQVGMSDPELVVLLLSASVAAEQSAPSKFHQQGVH
jgi:hypothetical protein